MNSPRPSKQPTGTKPVNRAPRSINDVDAAFDYLLAEAPSQDQTHRDHRGFSSDSVCGAKADSPGTAANFVEALQQALDHLSRHPLTGSLRFAFELDIPELRTWSLNRFPYLIFYVCNNDDVDVWRILHAGRDIPTSLGNDGPAAR